MGQYSVSLVGESHYQDAIEFLFVGERVSLVHEPTNRYDKRAVKAVTSDGDTIGYVERDSWLTRLIVDDGKEAYAEVERIIGGERGKPSKGVVLLVATGKDAKEMMARSPSPRLKPSGTGCAVIFVAAGLCVPIAQMLA